MATYVVTVTHAAVVANNLLKQNIDTRTSLRTKKSLKHRRKGYPSGDFSI